VPQLRPIPLLLALVLASLASAWLNLNTGSAHIAVLDALQQTGTLDHQILLELRIPRMSTAFTAGLPTAN